MSSSITSIGDFGIFNSIFSEPSAEVLNLNNLYDNAKNSTFVKLTFTNSYRNPPRAAYRQGTVAPVILNEFGVSHNPLLLNSVPQIDAALKLITKEKARLDTFINENYNEYVDLVNKNIQGGNQDSAFGKWARATAEKEVWNAFIKVIERRKAELSGTAAAAKVSNTIDQDIVKDNQDISMLSRPTTLIEVRKELLQIKADSKKLRDDEIKLKEAIRIEEELNANPDLIAILKDKKKQADAEIDILAHSKRELIALRRKLNHRPLWKKII
ncbi:MAG: hypothetical protein H0W88_08520 [Parachlamydiaceae bacterium]|nr:hypothetical protein [Parachlamydiaceae bacterium]